jgi:hypothetical protein
VRRGRGAGKIPNIRKWEIKLKTIWAVSSIIIPILPASTVHAATLTTVTGTFTTSATNTGFTVADGNLIVTQTLTFIAAGGITGNFVAQDTVVLLASGDGTFFGSGTFTGTVLGQSGASQVSFSGTFRGFPTLPALQGQAIFYNGSGGLANFQAQGAIQGILNVGGTYTFQVVFT